MKLSKLAVRRREVDDEVVVELGRLQGELRRKLERLLRTWKTGRSPDLFSSRCEIGVGN